MKNLLAVLIVTFLVLCISNAYSADSYTEDAVQGTNQYQRVQDQSGVLSSIEITNLLQQIDAYENTSGNQLAMVLIPSLNGKDIQQVALQTAQRMGIGHKDKNNGILILVATKDHKISIQVGEGLEGAYPDIYAKQAIDVVGKYFKEGQYGPGLTIILSDIKAKTSAEFIKDNPPHKKDDGWWGFCKKHWLSILIVLIILVIIDFVTYPIKHDLWLLSILCIILSGGTSSSSGGGSFGGGSFGGGGSSGDW